MSDALKYGFVLERYGCKVALRYCWWRLSSYAYFFVKFRIWFPIKIRLKNRYVFSPPWESEREGKGMMPAVYQYDPVSYAVFIEGRSASREVRPEKLEVTILKQRIADLEVKLIAVGTVCKE